MPSALSPSPRSSVQGATASFSGWQPLAWLWGIVLGATLQLQQSELYPQAVYGWAMGLGTLASAWCIGRAGACKKHRGWRRCADHLGAMLAACALAWGLAGWQASQQMTLRLDPALEGADLLLQGTIVAMPQQTALGQRFRLQVDTAEFAGRPVAVPPLVDLAWYAQPAANALRSAAPAGAAAIPVLAAGQRWRLPVRLKAPHGSANPHGFDYELWMWEQGVHATGYVRLPAGARAGGSRQAGPQLLEAGNAHPVERLRQHVRDAMVHRLAPVAEGRRAGGDGGWEDAETRRARIAGVLVALVTGEQRVIDREDWRVFRTTGVAHLMAISGLHITVFAWAAGMVVGWCWRRSSHLCLWLPAPQVALVAGVLSAFAYAVFSGWGVPAQRTVLMLAMIAMQRLGGRPWPWYVTWLMACSAVVLFQPMALLQAGFWLSFLAVGILFASDIGAGGAHELSAGRLQGTKRRLLALLREQWIVTVAITPLSLLLFGQVSVVGLLANVLAIPWVTWVATPLALLGVVLPPLWDLAAWAMQILMVWLEWLARWPHAALWLPAAPWWAAVAAMAGGILLALPLPWQLRVLGLPCLLPALWWQPLRPVEGQFSLLALDVGQGQAVLVQTARHSLLYDTGPVYGPGSNAGDRVVVPALRALAAQGRESGVLDMLVLSHGDSDHTGGSAAVAEQLRPAQAMGSLTLQERSQSGLQALPWRDCAAGHSWSWDGVQFEVLHPDGPLPADERIARQRSGNSRSCVLRIQAQSYQGHAAAALLLGDLEKQQEQLLVQRGAVLRADLMLVPHHGSNTSSSLPLLAAVGASRAVAQTGYRNRFRHPAAPVVRRYAEQRIRFHSTVECGAASWQSTWPVALQCQRQTRPRYWQHRVHQFGANSERVDSEPLSERAASPAKSIGDGNEAFIPDEG
ncbi:DNA internalization-related competence protein ComEC/Rec2 [Comamonas odontotermitis]|uniref:DNA internalization-related competence protein ComEC/Rec2 n=1 Tax=Comamonas odontotermitis TaxID=379895 RepID=UPI003752B8D9